MFHQGITKFAIKPESNMWLKSGHTEILVPTLGEKKIFLAEMAA